MNSEIRLIVDAVSNEKDIPKEVIFEALEVALEMATKKKYGQDWDVRIEIDRKTGDYQTFRRWLVVDDAILEKLGESLEEEGLESKIYPNRHLYLEQALVTYPNAVLGEYVESLIESIDFGRIAAQTAKQVILQRLRMAKRDKVAEDFKSSIGQLLSGTIKQVKREQVVMDLGNNAEGLLPRSEMLPREQVRVGDRVRAYLKEVKTEQRGPQLFVSRACPEMLIELFKIEVPEIGDGSIEIKGAARDPGLRAKIAVLAKDNRIDPVGACVGMRGSRVQAVSNELGGERVDIVLWDENPAQFVINAISPAEVMSIVVDDETSTMDVIVAEDQLAQAIGRGGQNVRLAAQLTGWILNVITEKESQEREEKENQRLLALFQQQLDTSEEVGIVLIEAGFTSLEEIAYIPIQELLALDGLEKDQVEKLREKAKDALLTQAIQQEERVGEHEPQADLLAVEGIDKHLAYQLASKGVCTQDDLAEQSVDDLLELEGMTEEKAGKLIMAARAKWFEKSE